MKNLPFAAILAALTIALPTCPMAQETAERPMTAAEIAQSDAWHNLQQAALTSRGSADGWHVLEGGVRFRRIEGDGSGPAPTVNDIVTVHYSGSLTNGAVFDSTDGRGPATFPLRQLVRAWQVAIPYMGEGDVIEIAVPFEMGYGPRGGGPIPPYATLMFTIELVNVMVPPGG